MTNCNECEELLSEFDDFVEVIVENIKKAMSELGTTHDFSRKQYLRGIFEGLCISVATIIKRDPLEVINSVENEYVKDKENGVLKAFAKGFREGTTYVDRLLW